MKQKVKKVHYLHWDDVSPHALQEVKGHDYLVGEEGALTKIIESEKSQSLILWGPPGCGKTTMSALYGKSFPAVFMHIKLRNRQNRSFHYAVKQIRKLLDKKNKVIFFIDEIHYLMRADQKILSSLLDNQDFTLVAATIYHPKTLLITELREKDIQFHEVFFLDNDALDGVLNRCEERYGHIRFSEEGRGAILEKSKGCGRKLLKMIELVNMKYSEQNGEKNIFGYPFSQEKVDELVSIKKAEMRTLSKFTLGEMKKAICSSRVRHALGLLAFLLEIEVDAKKIFEVLIKISVDDVGLGDPKAFSYLKAAFDAYYRSPEEKRATALIKPIVYLTESQKARQFNLDYINEGKTFIEDNADRGFIEPELQRKRAFYHPIERRYRKKIMYEMKHFPKLQKQIRKEMIDEDIK